MVSTRRQTHLPFALALMVICVVCFGAKAQQIPGPLTVEVRSEQDNKPIHAVTVHVGGRIAVTDPQGRTSLDGIPAGTYDLWCQHPGYLAYRRSLSLPNGQREAQVMLLTPEVLAPVKFMLTEAISGEPISGARIHMTPKDVKSALQGPLVSATDHLGQVNTIPIPVGDYQLRVDAPGLQTLDQVYSHKPQEKPIELKLQAVTQTLSYQVEVKDTDGQALAGAQVQLWEVYPLARIASSPTSGQGVARFDGLRIGQINPVQPDGSLAVAHRAEAVVRVEAPGYVTALQSLRLTDGGQHTVTLAKPLTIKEQEPNNAKGNALRLLLGQSASFTIDENRDEDWFRFDLAEPTQVKVVLSAAPIDIYLNLYDGAGRHVGQLGKSSGRTAEGVWNLAAGHYAVQLTEWGMNNSSKNEVILTLTGEVAADPFEDNNSAAGARTVEVGQHLRGIIFPLHDQDHFTLHLDRPGHLRLESINAPPIERHVAIIDKAGKHRGVLGLSGGRGGVQQWQFEPGDYEVVVTEWGNNNCALAPYDLRFSMLADDSVDDPLRREGTRLSSVRYLPLRTRTYSTINPVGDRDLFTVSIPSQGVLHVFQQCPIELSVNLLNGKGDYLRSGNSSANRSVHWTFPFTEATTMYLEVMEWGNNGWSPYPYELQTWFDPGGESECLLLNDSVNTAVPIELGEIVRDSIMPTGDQDWYRLYADQPGLLNVWTQSPVELSILLHNDKVKHLGTLNCYTGREAQINWNVVPGVYYLQVTEWGNNGEAPSDYALRAVLQRAVPGETANLAQSPTVQLKLGEARPCGIEQVGDVERFRISLPDKGEYVYWMGGPLETSTEVKDLRTGQVLFHHSAYANRTMPRGFSTEGPMELSLTVGEWGNNGASIVPNWVMVGPKDSSLQSPAVAWQADPLEPTRVTFTLSGTPGMEPMERVALDINNDGRADGTVLKGQPTVLNFPKQGLYRVTTLGAPGGPAVHGEFWVQATGQPVREGLHVMVTTPGEGEFIEQDTPVRVAALSYEGKPIRQVSLEVEGRSVGTDYTVPYEFAVPWEKWAGGTRILKATAVDSTGKQEVSEREVQVSDYFNLLPAAGAVVTGQDVTVSWDGSGFGTAKVRYRLKEDQAWQEVIGQNARSRRVRLTDLEAGKTYVFQPLGGAEPGPEREVTRVKGLAFTEPFYGGNIARDYDQKLPVAVRNHADEPRTVRLRCDLPRNSLLLAEFVGDGEKGRPVELGPGEQRSFSLGFSAQDVIKEMHQLPIYIESEDGYSDEALVEVRVKLPTVDLVWKDITPESQDALRRVYDLYNQGDTLTDLNVGTQHDRLRVFPEVKHGLIKAGEHLQFEVYPKIYEGFTACEDTLTATAIQTTAIIDYRGALGPGEQVFRLNMTAGLDPVTEEPDEQEGAIRAARRLVGQYLSPTVVDWSQRTDPQDTDRDGIPDRWTVLDDLNQTQWFGRDTDGDGQVDFAQADVGLDGEIDHASILEEGQWQPTNLLDAWLEMNFSIPKHRSQYQPHDLDLVVNGQVVGQLEQTIPEGNYRFPLAPSALGWGAQANTLEIKSHFLNYAHYAISSDFQLKTRMLNTDMYTVGTSREDALNRFLESDKGFSTDSPDYSLSSEDLDYSPKTGLKMGVPVTITGSVRNLGAGVSERLELGLYLAIPGTEGKELTRILVDPPGMMTHSEFEFAWPASAGHHSLRVVADPDNLLGESNRKNNAALVNVTVPGEDQPPTLTVQEPVDALESEDGRIGLLAQATDDAGIIGVTATVDDDLAQPLYRTPRGYAGLAHLQPGSHRLRFEAIDSGGNRVQEVRTVTVTAAAPEFRIIAPQANAELDASSQRVQVAAADVEQTAVRVNNGPWFEMQFRAGNWTGLIDLPFGQCDLEVVAIGADGMRQTQAVRVTCTAQPQEEEQEDWDKDPAQEDEDQDPAEADKNQDTGEQTQDAQTAGGGGAGDSSPDRPQAGQDTQTPQGPPQGQGRDAQGPQVGRDPSPSKPQGQSPQATGPAQTPRRPRRTPTGSGSSDTSSSGSAKGKPASGKGQAKGDTGKADDATGGDQEEPAGDMDKPIPVDIPPENAVTPPADAQDTAAPFRPVTPTRNRPPAGRRSPQGFAVNRQRNDWYCPNRPHIKINFKLPEWLTKEEFDKILKKGPNSKEWKALESRLLAGFWYRGFGKKVNGQTMDQLLLKYRDLLLKRCGRLDQPDGKLPGFLQSLGLALPDPPSDPKELEAWRNKMKELTQVYWLRLLATEDPATVMRGMKQRAQALGKFDEAAQMQAEAVIKEIEANQKITQDVLEALPFTGDALDILAAVTGESLSGEQLSGWERFFRAACVAGPVALEEALKRSPRAQEALSQILAATGEMSTSMKNSLLTKLGIPIDKFDELAETTGKFLTKERHIFAKNADEVVDSAKTAYKQTAEGLEDLKQMRQAKEASQKTVDELSDAVKRGGMAGDAEMEDILIRMQKDKTAQTIMNGADVPDPVRKRANETMKKIYGDVDTPTMQRIKDSPDVQELARRHGIEGEMEVTVWNPTNTKGPRPGEPGYVDPDFKKFGRDRDVTYQITGKTKDGRTVTLDVNHDISKPIYEDEFFKRCNGGRAPKNAAEAEQFAKNMDQMVTSKWHREAYNTGSDVHIDDWLNNDISPPVARPEDIRDTMITKSQHWFGEAQKAGRDSAKYSKDMAEGMRQATKQWDNFIAKRASQYGADVPVQLEKAMDVFKQVQNGSISPKQAEHMLEQLGNMTQGSKMTPQKVVENMAHYFEALEKGPGKAFKNIKTKELANALESVGDVGRKTDMIDNAYRSGEISGETYRQMRQGSFKLPPDPTPAQKQQLKTWALSAWHRRGISMTEKKAIEEQVGPLEE